MDHFLKLLLTVLQYCFCFMLWIFSQKSCGLLASWPGIIPYTSCVGRQSLNHWTTREVLYLSYLIFRLKYLNLLSKLTLVAQEKILSKIGWYFEVQVWQMWGFYQCHLNCFSKVLCLLFVKWASWRSGPYSTRWDVYIGIWKLLDKYKCKWCSSCNLIFTTFMHIYWDFPDG